jgi:AcrR family transcriptional regulator
MPNMKDTIKKISINLFYKKGYFATSISELANAAGIQKSSIYYHYSNKEEILFDIFKTTMIDLDTNLEKNLNGLKSADKRMRAAVHAHIMFHIERQKEVIISDSELRGLAVNNYKTITRMRDDYERKFQELIKSGIKGGTFIDTDAKIISYGIITMCTAVSLWFRPRGRLTKKEIAKIYTDFIMNGLRRKNCEVGL